METARLCRRRPHGGDSPATYRCLCAITRRNRLLVSLQVNTARGLGCRVLHPTRASALHYGTRG